MEPPSRLEKIYRTRFADRQDYRKKVWQVLIEEVFSKWIVESSTVLDLGCGHGEFINQIQVAKKFGMDLNPSTKQLLETDVVFCEQDCSKSWPLPLSSLDLVFTSNFFEHLPSKACLASTLQEAFQALKPGGRLIAMGPNIKVVRGRYWDFWDHYLELTELSLAEGLKLAGFEVESAKARFLPYTMVGSPKYPLFMLAWYLRCPLVWQCFGEQFLVVARKPLPLTTGESL